MKKMKRIEGLVHTSGPYKGLPKEKTDPSKPENFSKYKTRWKRMSLNKRFWNEVMKGRTITKVNFDNDGITSLDLDSGERIFLACLDHGGRICIQDGVLPKRK